MKIGNKVSVKTKHYGEKIGVIIEARPNKEWPQMSEYLIKPDDHPRNIIARTEDIKIIN